MDGRGLPMPLLASFPAATGLTAPASGPALPLGAAAGCGWPPAPRVSLPASCAALPPPARCRWTTARSGSPASRACATSAAVPATPSHLTAPSEASELAVLVCRKLI